MYADCFWINDYETLELCFQEGKIHFFPLIFVDKLVKKAKFMFKTELQKKKKKNFVMKWNV